MFPVKPMKPTFKSYLPPVQVSICYQLLTNLYNKVGDHDYFFLTRVYQSCFYKSLKLTSSFFTDSLLLTCKPVNVYHLCTYKWNVCMDKLLESESVHFFHMNSVCYNLTGSDKHCLPVFCMRYLENRLYFKMH